AGTAEGGDRPRARRRGRAVGGRASRRRSGRAPRHGLEGGGGPLLRGLRLRGYLGPTRTAPRRFEPDDADDAALDRDGAPPLSLRFDIGFARREDGASPAGEVPRCVDGPDRSLW